MRRLGAPRRMVNVLEGESLVNDATALVAYKVAVAAAVGGELLAADAGLEFFGVVAGGIAIGLARRLRRRRDPPPRSSDPITEVTISLFTGYAAFLAGRRARRLRRARRGHRRHLPRLAARRELISPETRLQGFAVWEILVFLLNATLFILIGLQLPVIVDGLDEAGRRGRWSATRRWSAPWCRRSASSGRSRYRI